MTIAFDPCRTTSAIRASPADGSAQDDDDWELISPVPDLVPAPSMRHWILGDAVAVWIYRDKSGGRVCFIGRYNKADGEKEFRPRTWRRNRETGKEEWRWKNVPDPRPLYGLELLAERPDAPVIVVEGEKCADAARLIFPDCVAVSPMNGARSPQLADWSPLRARDVTICGDNDKPGEAFVADRRPYPGRPGLQGLGGRHCGPCRACGFRARRSRQDGRF